jgi:ribonucleoside-diphosphate reductase subunit M1
MAADRAPFIDQSQSMNIYMANPTLSKITSSHFHSWEKGLKTLCYYVRTKAISTGAKHLAVDVSKIQQPRATVEIPKVEITKLTNKNKTYNNEQKVDKQKKQNKIIKKKIIMLPCNNDDISLIIDEELAATHCLDANQIWVLLGWSYQKMKSINDALVLETI